MKKERFDKLLDSMKDAAAYVRGDTSKGRAHVVRKIDVAKCRAALGLTQEEFSAAFGVSMATLRNWEQGHRNPTGPARVLLQVIEKEPEAVLRAVRLAPRKKKATQTRVRRQRKAGGRG